MRFIPALGCDALTPAYDAFIRLTLPKIRFKSQLIQAAAIAPRHHVLDVGCGTGTLLLLAGRAHPEATFVGIDPDPRILVRARRKVPAVKLEESSATALPFADEIFDRVLSSLVLHHLNREGKVAAMREIFRVLKPRGEFHLGDFGPPDSRTMRIVSFLIEKTGLEHVEENFRGMLPSMLMNAGFESVKATCRFPTIFGVLRCIRAVKPVQVESAPGGQR